MLKNLNQNKKALIHILFWMCYFLLFSFIWVKNGDYKSSFFLEFILLPVRIFCVYFTVLFLLPEFLLKKKFLQFVGYYFLLLIIAGILQRTFIFFFLEGFNNFDLSKILEFSSVLRSIVLINSTVLFVASIYVLNFFFKEKEKNILIEKPLELKSNKRTYTITESQILHIESLGNYVSFFLVDESKIIVYKSLKECLNELSDNFIRIHKSHIINKKQIKSFSKDNVELVSGKLVPIGNSANIKDIKSITIK